MHIYKPFDWKTAGQLRNQVADIALVSRTEKLKKDLSLRCLITNV